MNEQIKQLMSQTLDDKFSHTWTTMTYEDLAKFSEKFAELVINECCLKLLDMDEKTNGRHNYYKHASLQIEEHFEIKK